MACKPLGTSAAVLVVLQLGEGRLGAAVEPRQHERLRVGLLELLDTALAQVVEDLLARGPAVQERGEGGAVVRGDELEQLGTDVPLVGRRLHSFAGGAAQLALEAPLDGAPEAEQLGVPLAVVGHALETAVVQLVDHPQGQLDVVVPGDLTGSEGQGGIAVSLTGECLDDVPADRPAFLGQVHGLDLRLRVVVKYPARAKNAPP